MLILIRIISVENGENLFSAITRFITTRGKGFLMVILMLPGAFLIAGVIGLTIGHPILPVPDSSHQS